MPKVKCPLPDCEFETEDREAPIVAALITAYSLSHSRGNEATAKIEKVRRPTISASGTSELLGVLFIPMDRLCGRHEN